MPQLNNIEIGAIGYGLMGLTWRPTPLPDDQTFPALKAALAAGMNFWNGGEFYGPPDSNSLTLLERYFAKYPEDASKVVLSVKGAIDPKTHRPDGSRAGIRRSLDNCLRLLNGRKKIDIFECARRDPTVPQEETFAAIQEYIDRGLVGGIGLSEVAPATIHEAVKHASIVAVEVELSLFCPDILGNGVAAACAQYDIPLVAYSPVGRGILSGTIRTPADLPPQLRSWPRFQPDVFDLNLELVKQVEQFAARKSCTPAQLAIAWTRAIARRPGMPRSIIPIPGSTRPAVIEENAGAVDVELTDEEMDEIDATLAKFEIKGERYPDGIPVNT
ncbi:NADP-dependent oxidoreductase domain-containing protein [Echria macrotheca]|uniref:NADP-dependent oxidoreductase domain-containing protein n=1 Tax=Echria macrotheca TaxID=438768 RepID=A0AAJ0BDC5_9PEZI|nr:NADP-dependent oxidoreductase domain-containing protein [Echria macrotheca]